MTYPVFVIGLVLSFTVFIVRTVCHVLTSGRLSPKWLWYPATTDWLKLFYCVLNLQILSQWWNSGSESCMSISCSRPAGHWEVDKLPNHSAGMSASKSTALYIFMSGLSPHCVRTLQSKRQTLLNNSAAAGKQQFTFWLTVIQLLQLSLSVIPKIKGWSAKFHNICSISKVRHSKNGSKMSKIKRQ